MELIIFVMHTRIINKNQEAMKNEFFIFCALILALSINTFGQKASMSISFTATFNSINVQIDSVRITNNSPCK